MELHLRLKKPSRRLFIMALIVMLIGIGLYWWLGWRDTSTIPANIRHQAPFKTVYPARGLVKTTAAPDFQYSPDIKALKFNLRFQGQNFVVTEQSAPTTLANDSQLYFQSLGLHPVAQFTVKAGPVAICNFYRTKTLETQGQAGILISGKTMVIVTALDDSKKPTNDQWLALFQNLKVSR